MLKVVDFINFMLLLCFLDVVVWLVVDCVFGGFGVGLSVRLVLFG